MLSTLVARVTGRRRGVAPDIMSRVRVAKQLVVVPLHMPVHKRYVGSPLMPLGNPARSRRQGLPIRAAFPGAAYIAITIMIAFRRMGKVCQ